MKSFVITDHELHKKIKLLSVQLEKDITELVEEALKDLLEKYNERDSTRE